MSQQSLDKVFEIILDRKKEMSDNSYTVQLLKKGDNKILKKIGEESTELVMAAVKDDKKEISYECADLIYHMMVLLAHKNIPLTDIYKELESRMGISGLEEKAQRGKNG